MKKLLIWIGVLLEISEIMGGFFDRCLK